MRLLILGAVAATLAIGSALAGGTENAVAQCNAFLGSRNDGICIDGPSAPAAQFPAFGVGPTEGGGPGITTGPLLPGQQFGGYMPIA